MKFPGWRKPADWRKYSKIHNKQTVLTRNENNSVLFFIYGFYLIRDINVTNENKLA
jgi:hypothetical protein